MYHLLYIVKHSWTLFHEASNFLFTIVEDETYKPWSCIQHSLHQNILVKILTLPKKQSMIIAL
jgi:hypothetical protein